MVDECRPCGDCISVAAYVLKHLPWCLRWIAEYQDGTPGGVHERMLERFLPVLISQCFLECWNTLMWPEDCRPLQCISAARIVPLSDLYLYERVRDRRFALHLAIAEGEGDIVRQIWKWDPSLVTKDAFTCAVRYNQVEMMEWFIQFVDQESIMRFTVLPFVGVPVRCIKCQRKETLEMLHRLGFPITNVELTMIYLRVADDAGLEYLYEIGGDETPPYQLICILETAIKRNLTALVERILEHVLRRQEEIKRTEKLHWIPLLFSLDASGQLEWVKIVLALTCGKGREFVAETAARANHIHVLNWIRYEYNCQRTSPCLWRGAILKSSVTTLRWLATHNATSRAEPWLTWPVFVSDVEVAMIIHHSGQPLRYIVPISVDVVRYFVKQGITFENRAFHYVFREIHTSDNKTNRLDMHNIVRLMHEASPKCVFDEDVLESAAQYGTLSALMYVIDHSRGGCKDRVMTMVMRRGDLEMTKYLRKVRGYTWSSTDMYSAIASDSIELVKYLIECDRESVMLTVRGFDKLEWSWGMLEFLTTELPLCADVWLVAWTKFGALERVRSLNLVNVLQLRQGKQNLKTAILNAIGCSHTVIFEYLWCKYREIADSRHASNVFPCKVHHKIVAMKTEYPFSGPWDRYVHCVKRPN